MANGAKPAKGRGLNHSALAAWIFGAALLVYLMVVAFAIPDPTESQNKLFTFFMALLGALFAFFFIGEVLLKGKVWGMQVSATGGIAIFLVVLKWGDAVDVRSSAGSHLPGLVRKDPQVQQAQEFLSSAGLLNKVPDGVRDTATTQAIRIFQQRAGGTPSGLLTPELLNKMRITPVITEVEGGAGSIIKPISDSMDAKGHNTEASGGYSVELSAERIVFHVFIKAKGTKVNTDGRGNVIVALLDRAGAEIRSYKHTATFGKNPLKKNDKNASFSEGPLTAEEASRFKAGGAVGLVVYIDAQSNEWYDSVLREIVTALPTVQGGRGVTASGWKVQKVEPAGK